MVENVDPEELAAIQRNLFEENKKDLERSKILFYGGPVDGETVIVPNGDDTMKVDTAFGSITYSRDPLRNNVFIPGSMEDVARGL